MQRTGKLIYTVLIEVDAVTGQPTGNTKPNIPGDPDYIPPIDDPIACPLLPEPTTTTTSTSTTTSTTTSTSTTTTTSTTTSSTTTTTSSTTTTTTEEPTSTTSSTTTTTTLAPPAIVLNYNGVNYGAESTVNLGQNFQIDFQFRNLSAYQIQSAPHPNGGTVGWNSGMIGEETDPTYSIKWINLQSGAFLAVSVPIDGDIFQSNDYLQYSFNYEDQETVALELAIYDPSNGGALVIKRWYIGLATP